MIYKKYKSSQIEYVVKFESNDFARIKGMIFNTEEEPIVPYDCIVHHSCLDREQLLDSNEEDYKSMEVSISFLKDLMKEYRWEWINNLKPGDKVLIKGFYGERVSIIDSITKKYIIIDKIKYSKITGIESGKLDRTIIERIL